MFLFKLYLSHEKFKIFARKIRIEIPGEASILVRISIRIPIHFGWLK